METLEKMTMYFAWILVVVCPLYLATTFWLQKEYEDSLKQAVERIQGYQTEYYKYNFRAFLIFAISVVYLIAAC